MYLNIFGLVYIKKNWLHSSLPAVILKVVVVCVFTRISCPNLSRVGRHALYCPVAMGGKLHFPIMSLNFASVDLSSEDYTFIFYVWKVLSV